MRRFRLIIALMSVVCVSGCRPAKIVVYRGKQLRTGMSSSEVEAALGKPTESESRKSSSSSGPSEDWAKWVYRDADQELLVRMDSDHVSELTVRPPTAPFQPTMGVSGSNLPASPSTGAMFGGPSRNAPQPAIGGGADAPVNEYARNVADRERAVGAAMLKIGQLFVNAGNNANLTADPNWVQNVESACNELQSAGTELGNLGPVPNAGRDIDRAAKDASAEIPGLADAYRTLVRNQTQQNASAVHQANQSAKGRIQQLNQELRKFGIEVDRQ